MNLKNTILTIAVAFLIFFIAAKNERDSESPDVRKTIAVSTFSLYDMAKHIVGESADVFMILPFGVDAHSYEPTPKQIIKLYKSDLVIYSGAGLEPWTRGFEFQNRAIDMSLHVELKELGEHAHEHSHAGAQNNLDPHYWLDVSNMIKSTEYMTNELIELLPKNREFYTKNRDSYIDMLKKLDLDYRETLSTCKKNTIVVNHNAFSYIASRYGFEVEALSGLSPEAEPSAKSMADLIGHVKEHKLKTIFFESFVSDKAIKSIANEANVSVDVLQPLGNITADEAKQKLSYEEIMRTNLEKISKALECQ